MTTKRERIPLGPAKEYNPTQDLLSWLTDHFNRFGDIYKASVYGTDVYVVSDPQCADYVLRRNWQNYRKGQAIKRIGLLLGNGLMVSEGEFWKSQRRMIQPAFHQKAIGALTNVITAANVALLKKWEGRSSRERACQYHARHQPDGPEGGARFHLRRRLRTGCAAFQHSFR